MTIHPAYRCYNTIGNDSLSPMTTTKPTTITYPTFHVAEQQQYHQQTMRRVHTHELKTRLIPTYVPTSNTVTMMTLQHQQRQGQRQQQQQPHSDPLQHEEEEEIISFDASSLPSFGSIRPDPNYDPAGDPMNPMNQHQFQQPFIPPSEISIIKRTGRAGRRRKTVGRGEKKNEEQQPQQRQQQQRHYSPLQPVAQQQIQQRSENNPHPSPVLLCRSQSPPPPPLRTPIMDSPAPSQMTTPINWCSSIRRRLYSAVSKSTTSTTRLSVEEQQQFNVPPSRYYDQQQHRREESFSLKLISNDIFHNDNNTTNTTDNMNDDDIAQQQQEQEQEQQQKQRKGMILRMLGRKVLRLKQQKRDRSNSSNDVLGNNTDYHTDSTDIAPRVFDAVVNSDTSIAVAAAVV